jgi:potassium-dependent mechanosensitive channel
MMRNDVVLGPVLSLVMLLAPPALAQVPAPPTPAQEPAQEPAVAPGGFEVAARAGVLADSAVRAERTIQRLAATGALEAELEDAARRHGELQALLGEMIGTEFVRLERLSRLRDQALLEDNRLEALRARLVDRLTQLGELRAQWVARQRTWREWRAELAAEPEYAVIQPELQLAIQRIDSVLVAASAAATDLLALQRRAEEIRGEIDQIGMVVSAVRTGRRRALLERGQPVLLSSAHRAELAEGQLQEWDPWATIQPAAYFTFVRNQLGLLGFYLLLALFIGAAARWLRRAPAGGGQGAAAAPEPRLLDHPWALGALAAAVVAMQRITVAPPLWDVLLWGVFGASAGVLSRAVLPTRALRLTVYLLAVFYPVFLLLEVLQLPMPVFRLGLAAVAAVAIPVFLLLARRRVAAAAAADSRDPRRIWPLRIGAVMWITVLVAVAVGHDALGRWILHAAVTSAAVVFVVVLVFDLSRRAVARLAGVAPGAPFLRRAGARVAERALVLVRVALVVAATLVLLDVWDLAESPVATWQWLMNAGFSIGTLRVTVGGIVAAALVLYLAVLTSGLVRSLVAYDFERHPERDRGLVASISRLVHYAVVTFGLVMGLAVLGVELQNFAIVAGALGIGVGFGLQNVVNNFASGLILLFERPVRVGDTVVVDEVWGTIQKIGLRSTVMVTFDQSEMIVPNADLVSEKVTNWTLSNPTARIVVPVGVAYGSPVARVLGILREAAFAHETVLREPPPEALFVGFGDSSLDFELRVWVRNIRSRLQVRSAILAEIDARFRAEDIEIPFPQRDLHLRSVDPTALARLGEKPRGGGGGRIESG